MSSPREWPDEVWQPEGDAPRRGANPFLAAAAWFIILVAVVLIAVGRELAQKEDAPRGLERSQLVVEELLGRYIVGAKELIRPPQAELERVAGTFPAAEDNPPAQLCRAILEGEIRGPPAALDVLGDIKPDQDDVALAKNILLRLYQDLAAGRDKMPSVTAEQRDWLKSKLGWFGDLALHPSTLPRTERLAAGLGAALALAGDAADPRSSERQDVIAPAERTLITVVLGVGSLVLLAFAGLIALIAVIVLAKNGKLQAGMGEGVSYHGVYAETFALWLIAFVGGSVLLQAQPDLDLLQAGGLAMMGSLAVLLWPVLRGVPWRQVCKDIGWSAGEKPLAEPLYGLFCYLLALPLVALGMTFYVSLAGGAFGMIAAQTPSHPILDYLIRDDGWTRFRVYLVACVIAPIVEETMFRGVFYRHVRDVTRGAGGGWSFIASAMLVSFIFAVIHPQGLMFTPVLMGLAIAMTIGREWRGTLVTPIALHALSNGIMLTIVINALE